MIKDDASADVVQRLGRRLEARLVENEFFQGEWTTKLEFALLASEWTRHRGLFNSGA
jgi:RimJ/RimL family protein N-acetyltransferase